MPRQAIHTARAPAAIGTYSQAVAIGNLVHLSGQIPLNPETDELETSPRTAMIQVFENLRAVAEATGGALDDIAKVNIYLTDLDQFSLLNEIMAEYFSEPYPARAAIEVNALPKGACVEIDAVMVVQESPVDS